MDGLLKLFLDTDRKHYVLELFKLILTLVTSVKLYDFLFGIQLQPIPITANYLQDVYMTFIDGSIVPPLFTFLTVWFIYFVLLENIIFLTAKNKVLDWGYEFKQKLGNSLNVASHEERKKDDKYFRLLIRFNVFERDRNGLLVLGTRGVEAVESMETNAKEKLGFSFLKGCFIVVIQLCICVMFVDSWRTTLPLLAIIVVTVVAMVYLTLSLVAFMAGVFIEYRTDVLLKIMKMMPSKEGDSTE
jgi:ABC-type multidrug transport system fused ATPase/permease subunit